jgi:hypothetical protein
MFLIDTLEVAISWFPQIHGSCNLVPLDLWPDAIHFSLVYRMPFYVSLVYMKFQSHVSLGYMGSCHLMFPLDKWEVVAV